ncbi:DUF6212 domain-containing protein [Phyllobacterium sp. 628]|uniref:DUF6212 domain-containing protein n=1 Tax=Phyllobacterium sp. 628 TaxID=2718938 RepID=UPI001FCE77FC|nr:DUF6212 domain-containing protein [Phyllobacterium sp. 628]
MSILNTPLPATVDRQPRKSRYAIASTHDRSILEASPLHDLIVYLEPDSDQTRLLNTFPLIAIATSDEGAAALQTALKQLFRFKTLPNVPIIRLDAAAIASEAVLVAQVLENGLERLTSHVTKVHAELAMLRRERETLFENYRAIENAFHARNWDSVTEVFGHTPNVDPKDEGFANLLRESEIEQLFPVSSYAVSGFALHFRSQPSGRSGQLIVTLDYLENGEGVAEWLIPYASVVADWNFFSLPKACDGGHRTLRLRVSATGGIPPELSLGNVITNERYAARARIPHADLDMRPLAFRVFTGLPGVRPTSLPNVFTPTSLIAGRRVEDYRLPVELLRGVTNVSVSQIQPDFPTVRFLEHEDAIVCHPLKEGITAGVIRRVVAPGTVRISARALIDHPEGQPGAVGFLLTNLAADIKGEIANLGRPGDKRPASLFSGWTEITAAQPTDINFMLDAATTRAMDLVVLSKATTDSVDFSWLKVFNFRLVKHLEARPVQEMVNAR